MAYVCQRSMMVARLGTMGYAMEALKGTLGFAVFGALWAR